MFDTITQKCEPTDDGYRVTFTAKIDQRWWRGMEKAMEREAKAGRIVLVTNIAP